MDKVKKFGIAISPGIAIIGGVWYAQSGRPEGCLRQASCEELI